MEGGKGEEDVRLERDEVGVEIDHVIAVLVGDAISEADCQIPIEFFGVELSNREGTIAD